jgi:site-specific DNA-cytosine methylase
MEGLGPAAARRDAVPRPPRPELLALGGVASQPRLRRRVAEIRADRYGTPTIRKRLYVIARCDGEPIVWPAPTHARCARRRKPWRTAAECINWEHRGDEHLRARSAAGAQHDATARQRRVEACADRIRSRTSSAWLTASTRTGPASSHGAHEPLRTFHASGGNYRRRTACPGAVHQRPVAAAERELRAGRFATAHAVREREGRPLQPRRCSAAAVARDERQPPGRKPRASGS